MPPVKRTAATRTAPRRIPANADVIDFDAARVKKKKSKVAASLHAYDKNWTLKMPNQVVVGELSRGDSMSSITDYLLAHIVKDERQDFLDALTADEDMDLNDALLLAEKLTEAVYKDLPTPAS